MVRVKICGITNITDAEDAVSSGADAIGFVFAESPRRVSRKEARAIIEKLPPFVAPVALFVDEDANVVKDICKYCNIHTIQFHGNETPEYLQQFPAFKTIKAFRIRNESDVTQLGTFKADAYLLDSYSDEKPGGTGKRFDWEIIRKTDATRYGRIIIAGGLNPANVVTAIKLTEPFGVDASSGVEASRGKKDKTLMDGFINAAKNV